MSKKPDHKGNVKQWKTVKDISGKRYGMLKIISFSHSSENRAYWNCICDCGNECVKQGKLIREGRTQSCGCLGILTAKTMSTKHGGRYDAEYGIYCGMIARCENPSSAKYKNYGGRGIKVCKRWRKSYANFIEDMGPRPTQTKAREYSIERINRNKGYSPSNCKWATYSEQANNRCSNTVITIKGRSQTVAQWASETGLAYNTIFYRHAVGNLKGIDLLSKPRKMNRTLTADDVIFIRTMHSMYGVIKAELARLFEVTYMTISHIVNYKTWKHI